MNYARGKIEDRLQMTLLRFSHTLTTTNSSSNCKENLHCRKRDDDADTQALRMESQLIESFK